jgi:hypothetical protein
METAPRRPTSYLVSIWPEHTADGKPAWRGVLVTPAGQRLPFSSLAQLNRWLNELTGWQDPGQDGALPSLSKGVLPEVTS